MKFVDFVGNMEDPDFLEIWIRGEVEDSDEEVRPSNNVFTYRRITPGEARPGAEELANQVQAILVAKTKLVMHEDYVALACTGRYMDDPWEPSFEGDVGENGTLTGDRCALFEAVTLKANTDGRGKHFRCNKHFSPLAESERVGDEIHPDFYPEWNDVKAALNTLKQFTDAGGNVWQMVVLARSLCDFTARPSLFTGADIGLWDLNITMTTMRRRRQKKSKYDPV